MSLTERYGLATGARITNDDSLASQHPNCELPLRFARRVHVRSHLHSIYLLKYIPAVWATEANSEGAQAYSLTTIRTGSSSILKDPDNLLGKISDH